MIANLQVQSCKVPLVCKDANDSAVEELRQQAIELLDRLVAETGLSLSQIAAKAGLTPSTLTRFRNQPVKHQLSAPTLAKIRAAFPASGDPGARGAAHVIPASENAVQLKQVDLGLSMGDGANLDDWFEEGTIEFDAGLLRSITRSPADRLFVARGEGDSMFPTLINEDMVVIDTMQRELRLQDRIWACSVHGAGAIKRLRAVGKQRVEVISDNPTVENREVDAEDLVLLGRVVWIGRKV